LIVGLRKVLAVERTLIIKHRSEQQARHAGRALDTWPVRPPVWRSSSCRHHPA
jgi:hypothetical protein